MKNIIVWGFVGIGVLVLAAAVMVAGGEPATAELNLVRGVAETMESVVAPTLRPGASQAPQRAPAAAEVD